MTRDELQALQCSAKRSYATAGQAQLAIDRTAKRHGPKMRKYRCEACDGWHLTSDLVGPRGRRK